MATSTGILPTDLVLRSVIQDALVELRQHPYLLDLVFAPLLADKTFMKYGQAQIDAAKRWFLRTEIPVIVAESLEPPRATCITVGFADGAEELNTLADVHYEVTADDDRAWPALAGPFDPVSWAPVTGRLVLPATVTDALVVVPGMVLVDATGKLVPVLEVPEAGVVRVAAGTLADWRGVTIRGARPAKVMTLGSVTETETYQIGTHVHGKVEYLHFLFPIVKFLLYRVRPQLEARGIERLQCAFSGTEQDQAYGQNEQVYSRYVTMKGALRQIWPQAIDARIYSVDYDLAAAQDGVVVDIGDANVAAVVPTLSGPNVTTVPEEGKETPLARAMWLT